MGLFPVEVLLQILQGAVDTLPIPDLLKMRVVNSLFANEIMTLLMQSPRLEEDGFGFADENRHTRRRHTGTTHYKEWWTKFPTHYKRQYLHRKVQQHPTTRCAFSTFIHEILALPHALRTKEEEHILTDKLIDAWLCGKFFPIRDVYYPHRRLWHTHYYSADFEAFGRNTYWEPIERTMAIALTTSAIIRGDCVELQQLLDIYDDPQRIPLGLLWERSDRFGGIRPVEIAALKGSPEAIRLLIANECTFEYDDWSRKISAFNMAARKGNMGALKVWIEHLKNTNQDLATQLNGAVMGAVRVQRPDVVEFIEKECGFQFDKSKVMFELFIENVVRARLGQVQYYLNWGGFDINMETERFRFGPLHGAISGRRGVPNLHLVIFLLKHGADPNKLNPTAKLTPLQVAVKKGNVALAKLLIAHGADISTSRFVQRKKLKVPLLHVAVEDRSAPMIRLLLENGLDRVYLYKGRTFEIKGDTVEGGNSQVRLQIKTQEAMRPIDDEKGYVVLRGDKVDKVNG